jgi:sigma-B regulation protein RsbU (phosphoserine phosphatase)
MKILIAEDSAIYRRFLENELQTLKYTVLTTRDGNEAWDIILKDEVSLVISDWMMPGLDGLELCRQIRAAKSARYIYFILLTALEGKSNYMEAMEAGVDDFISKPFDPDQLRARLNVAERIIGLQGQVKQLQGILPTCSVCKKIRDKNSEWVPIESYINQRTEADFSHTYCPDCFKIAMKQIE